MVDTLLVPDRYSWVLLVCVGALWVTWWQTSLVGKARKAANIPYPQVYAEKAEAKESENAMKFNCVQRAHQNTLESLPHTMIGMLITGLHYPEIAAALGVVWLAGRVVYTIGYSSGDPNQRMRGISSLYATAGLMTIATFTTSKLILFSRPIC